ncbi:DNA-binding NarL/FixJ family response regulator [Brachybacterium muris]|uniref:LuxR family transcriptional regulator n=1 Tax=Brachybacterium muris UCD-AY4 TaxID=1249481 RepID=A0A022KXH9_9MICO|nr:response regulator transcription factor [Brachybacterium muris]EYT47735.1 LuxR family transcriptional regulator [Brachybacterium muris UCD-AY4]MBM7500082.1 DNA-binding NarL/FixJ family response regulator [Brachybacterium muris]MCT1431052.1 response regulator transcription factor [Brachybacterium muris]
MTVAPARPTRVLIVDDQSMILGGFAALLSAQEGIEVAGTASDGVGITEVVRRTRPDVVLMDIRMPRVDGLEATRAVLAMPGEVPRIIMLTTFDADEYVFAALRAGASGFLLKDSTPEELVRAVRVVANGEALLTPRVTRTLIADYASRPHPSPRVAPTLSGLTDRELDVLRLVARGLANREVAAELVMAEQTVKTHVSRMLAKLQLRDRTQLVIAAYESGLVRAGD